MSGWFYDQEDLVWRKSLKAELGGSIRPALHNARFGVGSSAVPPSGTVMRDVIWYASLIFPALLKPEGSDFELLQLIIALLHSILAPFIKFC